MRNTNYEEENKKEIKKILDKNLILGSLKKPNSYSGASKCTDSISFSFYGRRLICHLVQWLSNQILSKFCWDYLLEMKRE